MQAVAITWAVIQASNCRFVGPSLGMKGPITQPYVHVSLAKFRGKHSHATYSDKHRNTQRQAEQAHLDEILGVEQRALLGPKCNLTEKHCSRDKMALESC